MINSVVIMGRLTYEPELRSTQSGVSVVRITIACERSYQKSNDERKADFIDVTAWRQTAEFISRYFHKGSMIAVEGSIQTDNYTDRDGNKRKSFQVVANNVSFCGSKAETGMSEETQPVPDNSINKGNVYSSADNSDFEEIIDDDDDLPF